MRRSQWYVFGGGLLLTSALLFKLTEFPVCIADDTNLFVACWVRRYAYAIPALLTNAVGLICLVCGFLEPKKK